MYVHLYISVYLLTSFNVTFVLNVIVMIIKTVIHFITIR
jgi:hypothetical protein